MNTQGALQPSPQPPKKLHKNTHQPPLPPPTHPPIPVGLGQQVLSGLGDAVGFLQNLSPAPGRQWHRRGHIRSTALSGSSRCVEGSGAWRRCGAPVSTAITQQQEGGRGVSMPRHEQGRRICLPWPGRKQTARLPSVGHLSSIIGAALLHPHHRPALARLPMTHLARPINRTSRSHIIDSERLRIKDSRGT